MSHATFAPSAARRWVACPGSYQLCLEAPQAPSSIYAQEGTDAHTYAAALLTNGKNSVALAADLAPDMIEAAHTYVKYVQDLRRMIPLAEGVERRVRHNDQLFGTADYIALVGTRLYVVDFKSGAGVRIDPKNNAQLMTYAMMALVEPDFIKHPIDTIEMVIVQPRIEGDDPIRPHVIHARALVSWKATVLEAMRIALSKDAPLVYGDHCRFCAAKPTCPSLQGVVVEAQKTDINTLTPEQLGEWLAKADVVEGWIGAIRQMGHEAATAGMTIPGWALKPKRATRKWSDPEEVRKVAVAARIAISDMDILSPTQVEKKFKGIPAKLLPFVVAQSSGFNLVKDASVTLPGTPAPSLTSALSKLQYRI